MNDVRKNSKSRRRVVITGIGAVTALGIGVKQTWQALTDGRSGVRQIRQFESDEFPVKIGSEVDISQLTHHLDEELAPLLTRSVQFGIAGLQEAWQDAGLTANQIDPWRSGVCVGGSNFPVIKDDFPWPRNALNDEKHYSNHYLALTQQMPELMAQREMSMVSTLLAIQHPLKGVNITVQTACASATQAIGEAYQMIRHGQADLMVSGGADSMLSALCVMGFTLLTVASSYQGDPAKACRPFDYTRDGLVLGEGSGIVILEELSHAQKRNARIYGEVIGYGSSCDAYRFTDSHPESRGPIRCMTAALQDAGLSPADIDYINAHGTATPQNDRAETFAMKQVLGDYAYKIPISSTKSQLGHLLCAAGGIELVVTLLAICNNIIPPTINLEHPDPACDLDYVPNTARSAQINVALSNSFGFGGQNGTLIVRRWQG